VAVGGKRQGGAAKSSPKIKKKKALRYLGFAGLLAKKITTATGGENATVTLILRGRELAGFSKRVDGENARDTS